MKKATFLKFFVKNRLFLSQNASFEGKKLFVPNYIILSFVCQEGKEISKKYFYGKKA